MPDRKATFIWERLNSRRPSVRLGYDAIVRASLKLADRSGLEAVSMRNVAAALGAGTMSLYRHVTGKEDLLDLILDAAYGEIPLPGSARLNWQQRLRCISIASRQVLKAHPWLAPLISRRPTLGPNYLRWFEFLLRSAQESGRPLEVRVRMIGTLWSYITGFIAYELGEIEANRRHDLTEAKKRRIAQPYVVSILATGNFPCLAEFWKSGLGQPTDEAFTAGLDAVLTGIQAM